MDLCNQLHSSVLPAVVRQAVHLSILHGKKSFTLDIMCTFFNRFFIPAMLIGNTDFYHSMPVQ